MKGQSMIQTQENLKRLALKKEERCMKGQSTIRIQEKVHLKPLTWWNVGGVADYFCMPQNVEELQQALIWAKERSLPVEVLGSGTKYFNQ